MVANRDVGVLTNNSKPRFERRKPYLVVDTALYAAAALLLGFTRLLASVFPHNSSNAGCQPLLSSAAVTGTGTTPPHEHLCVVVCLD